MAGAANTGKTGQVPPPHILTEAKVIGPLPQPASHTVFTVPLRSRARRRLKRQALAAEGRTKPASQHSGDLQELKEGQKGELRGDLCIIRIFPVLSGLRLTAGEAEVEKKHRQSQNTELRAGDGPPLSSGLCTAFC